MKTIIDKAFDYAREKMEGLKDDEGFDAVGHPLQVSMIIQIVLPEDHNLVCAALLHDVAEDCGVTHKELEENFNKDIADLVFEVTKEIPNNKSKPAYFPRLKTQRGILLKLADRLSNVSRMNSWTEKKKQWYLDSSKFWKSEEV